MERITELLTKRKDNGLLRFLSPVDSRNGSKIFHGNMELVDFSSNDYLALAGHRKLKGAAKKAIDQFGASSSASRLLGGDFRIHHELEEKVARFKGTKNALVFNSGYQANVGIIDALYGSGDAIFADKLSHASILDGIALSGARMFRFLHNDCEHLEGLLKKQRGKFNNCLIVTETIFSMDGDRAPLKGLVELKEKYGCKMMVDEAHATGIFGEKGSGIVEEENLTERVDLIMGTFSKGLGSFGAYLGCSQKIKDYLINTCRSFIYSTALPASVIAANIAALEVIDEEPCRRKTLLENAVYFRGELQKKGFDVTGQSQIVPLIVTQAERAIKISKFLESKGFCVRPIRYPTVPKGQERLRFSLTYHHSKEILGELAKQTGEALNV